MKKVLKFYSQTCSPCKMIQPMLEAKAAEGSFEIVEVDIADNEELIDKYDVMKVPTLIVLDEDGNEIDRAAGIPEINPMLQNY